jgi:hypothetical protein
LTCQNGGNPLDRTDCGFSVSRWVSQDGLALMFGSVSMVSNFASHVPWLAATAAALFMMAAGRHAADAHRAPGNAADRTSGAEPGFGSSASDLAKQRGGRPNDHVIDRARATADALKLPDVWDRDKPFCLGIRRRLTSRDFAGAFDH